MSMDLTIKLSPAIEAQIEEIAQKRGIAPDQVKDELAQKLSEAFQQSWFASQQQERVAAFEFLASEMVRLREMQPAALPKTGPEIRAYWKREGALGVFADRPDSPEYARQLRLEAETRERGA